MSGKLHQYLHLVELALEMVLLILESTLIYALYLPLKALLKRSTSLKFHLKKSCNACFGLVPGHKHMSLSLSSSLSLLSLLIYCCCVDFLVLVLFSC